MIVGKLQRVELTTCLIKAPAVFGLKLSVVDKVA